MSFGNWLKWRSKSLNSLNIFINSNGRELAILQLFCWIAMTFGRLPTALQMILFEDQTVFIPFLTAFVLWKFWKASILHFIQLALLQFFEIQSLTFSFNLQIFQALSQLVTKAQSGNIEPAATWSEEETFFFGSERLWYGNGLFNLILLRLSLGSGYWRAQLKAHQKIWTDFDKLLHLHTVASKMLNPFMMWHALSFKWNS